MTVALLALMPLPASAAESGEIVRLAGSGREGTAAAVAQRTHPEGASTVVLARSDESPDALVGAPLASAEGGPLLLTSGDGLSVEVEAELRRLSPARVLLLGGSGALGLEVEEAVRALGAEVLRYGGVDRFDTARLVAEAVLAESGADEAYVTAGGGWADAVAVAGLAAREGRPILLTDHDAVPAPTLDLLRERPLSALTVVGGVGAISDQTAASLAAAGPEVSRVAGESRYATARAVAELAGDATTVWLATGAAHADALAAGPAVAASGGVLLLLEPGNLAGQPAGQWIRDHLAQLRQAFIVGGAAAVPTELEAELATLMPTLASAGFDAEGVSVRLQVGANFQAAVNANPAGTRFVVATGTHRMQSVRPKAGNTFVGERGAVMSGARLLTQFARDGALWVATGQTQEAFAHGEMLPGRERDAHPEDLFINDVRLRHVGSRAQVVPGTWYFDYGANRILLADNPAGRTVETSVTAVAFQGPGVSNVTLDNLVVAHYANRAQQGAVHGDDTIDWTVTRVHAGHNHGVGIRIGPGMKVRNCRIDRNGQLGIGGVAGTRLAVIERNDISQNGQLGFNWLWEGGGTKFVASTGLRFERNWVHDNLGPGVWYDIDNVNGVIAYNLVERNTQGGMIYEISYGAEIAYNRVRDNGRQAPGDLGAGIYVSNSTDVVAHHNLLSGNRHEVMATHDDRGDGAHGLYELRGMFIHHNDITVHVGQPGVRAYNGDTRIYNQRNNRFATNTWRLANPDGVSFWWGRDLDRRGWQAQGNDLDGRFLRHGDTTAGPVVLAPFVKDRYGPQ